MKKIDLYDYPRRLNNNLLALEKDKKMCKENKKDIISFSKIRLAKGSSHGRVAKVVYCLKYLGKKLNKSFRKATKDDLIKLIGDLESSHYAEYTKYDFKIVLKMFYKWLKGNDEEFPPEIKWLKVNLKNENAKLPEDLLTEEEVLKISKCSETLRDKALILVLYESGCRIGEMMSLKLKNVQFDEYGAILRVTGKTGDRRIRIISSASVLANWVNMHPDSDNPEAVLWIRFSKKSKDSTTSMKHSSIYLLIRKLAKRAGIKRRVYPHLFRHSRATSLANKLTEAQMKEYFGWVQASDMAATYVHLSGRDVDDALLKMHGLVKDENGKDDKMRVRVCQRCGDKNSPISKFCIKCGLPLDEKFMQKIETERKSADNLMNKLMEDKEFRDLMMKKISEMGLMRQVV